MKFLAPNVFNSLAKFPFRYPAQQATVQWRSGQIPISRRRAFGRARLRIIPDRRIHTWTKSDTTNTRRATLAYNALDGAEVRKRDR